MRISYERAYHLLGNHHHSLGREAAVAVVEEVLQTRAEKVDDQNIVQALLAKVIDIRDTSYKKG